MQGIVSLGCDSFRGAGTCKWGREEATLQINVLTKDDKPKNIGQVKCNSFGSIYPLASNFSLMDVQGKGTEFLGH